MLTRPHIFARAIFSAAVGLFVGPIFPPAMPFISGGIAGAISPEDHVAAGLMTALVQLCIALPGFALIYHFGLALNRAVPPAVEVLLFVISPPEFAPELYIIGFPGVMIIVPLFNLIGAHFGSAYSST